MGWINFDGVFFYWHYCEFIMINITSRCGSINDMVHLVIKSIFKGGSLKTSYFLIDVPRVKLVPLDFGLWDILGLHNIMYIIYYLTR